MWDREEKPEVQENKGLWPKEAMVGAHENNGWSPGNQMFFLRRATAGFQERKAAVQKHNDYVTLNQSLYPCKPNGASKELYAAVRPHQWLGSKTPFAGVHEEMAGSPGDPGWGTRNSMVGTPVSNGWIAAHQRLKAN